MPGHDHHLFVSVRQRSQRIINYYTALAPRRGVSPDSFEDVSLSVWIIHGAWGLSTSGLSNICLHILRLKYMACSPRNNLVISSLERWSNLMFAIAVSPIFLCGTIIFSGVLRLSVHLTARKKARIELITVYIILRSKKK